MKIALLSPGSWWTHPKYYEPWETVVSLLYEGLVKRGVDVTLFTGNNSKTRGKAGCSFSSENGFPPSPPSPCEARNRGGVFWNEDERVLNSMASASLRIARLFEKAGDLT